MLYVSLCMSTVLYSDVLFCFYINMFFLATIDSSPAAQNAEGIGSNCADGSRTPQLTNTNVQG